MYKNKGTRTKKQTNRLKAKEKVSPPGASRKKILKGSETLVKNACKNQRKRGKHRPEHEPSWKGKRKNATPHTYNR